MYYMVKSYFVDFHFSLSLLVIVTTLTKALIWGSWLLSMCRHPGCRGNQSKVVSKRRAAQDSAVQQKNSSARLRLE